MRVESSSFKIKNLFYHNFDDNSLSSIVHYYSRWRPTFKKFKNLKTLVRVLASWLLWFSTEPSKGRICFWAGLNRFFDGLNRFFDALTNSSTLPGQALVGARYLYPESKRSDRFFGTEKILTLKKFWLPLFGASVMTTTAIKTTMTTMTTTTTWSIWRKCDARFNGKMQRRQQTLKSVRWWGILSKPLRTLGPFFIAVANTLKFVIQYV